MEKTFESFTATFENRKPPVNWVMEDPTVFQPRKSTAKEFDDVVFGRAVHSRCGGTGYIAYWEREETTGARRKMAGGCFCSQLKHRRSILEKILPGKYVECNFWTMEPSPVSKLPIETQRRVIDGFRKNPDISVIMYGKPGTSKTTYACALIRRAVERDWNYFWMGGGPCYWNREAWIWRVNYDTLMAQYLRQQGSREAPEPDVTPERIKAAYDKGKRFALCVEEVDKAKLTEHRANKLFDIIDTLYNCKGQLILTTNLTREQFEAFLTKTDNDGINVTGGAILRRIDEMCQTIDFFK